MALNHTRVTDSTVNDLVVLWGLGVEFDDTRLRQLISTLTNNIFTEMKNNMVVQTDVSAINLTVNNGTETYPGETDAAQSRTATVT